MPTPRALIVAPDLVRWSPEGPDVLVPNAPPGLPVFIDAKMAPGTYRFDPMVATPLDDLTPVPSVPNVPPLRVPAAIDSEKIGPLRRLAAKVTPLTGEETVEARIGLHSLLFEREELLADLEARNRFALESDATIEKLKGTVLRLMEERDGLAREVEARRATAERAIGLLPPGMTLSEVVAEREGLLSLLREVRDELDVHVGTMVHTTDDSALGPKAAEAVRHLGRQVERTRDRLAAFLR